MPRGKRAGTKIRYQVREARKNLDRVLDHLMAADVVAKGGVIDGHGKMLPAGIDIQNPDREGHPVLNEYLPVLVGLISDLREALSRLVVKL